MTFAVPIPTTDAELVREIEQRLLHERLSSTSEQVILREIVGESRTLAEGELRPLLLSTVTGLILGSPEFQRR